MRRSEYMDLSSSEMENGFLRLSMISCISVLLTTMTVMMRDEQFGIVLIADLIQRSRERNTGRPSRVVLMRCFMDLVPTRMRLGFH